MDDGPLSITSVDTPRRGRCYQCTPRPRCLQPTVATTMGRGEEGRPGTVVNLLKWARRSPREVWGHWPSKAYQERKFQFRLAGVQQHLAEAITSCPNASVRVTSLCAG